jgi:two-component system response regulator FixJ
MPLEMVYVVDESDRVRASLGTLLASVGHKSEHYKSGETFLEAAPRLVGGCALIDLYLSGIDGLSVIHRLEAVNPGLPAIAMATSGTINTALSAVRAGAIDYLEKPFTPNLLLRSLDKALDFRRRTRKISDQRRQAQILTNRLTPREMEIFQFLAAGQSNKGIARQLNISSRTIEVHRAHIMEKLEAASLPAALQIALTAGVLNPHDED